MMENTHEILDASNLKKLKLYVQYARLIQHAAISSFFFARFMRNKIRSWSDFKSFQTIKGILMNYEYFE